MALVISDVYIEFKSWDGQDPSLEPLPSMPDGHRNYERMKAPIDMSGNQTAIMTQRFGVDTLFEYPTICELPFYWKDISKDQEKLLMENESIGNFILRKSSSDPAAFTLVVKSYDFNYMVQIRNYFKPREGWGIAAYAPKFPYIADLIQHYQSHDLSTSPYLHSTSSMNGEDVSRGSVESLNSSQNKHSYIRLRESVNRDVRKAFQNLFVIRFFVKLSRVGVGPAIFKISMDICIGRVYFCLVFQGKIGGQSMSRMGPRAEHIKISTSIS